MSGTSRKKILLTGASGYIGGTILTSLLKSPSHARLAITVLVRDKDQADMLDRLQGVTAMLFEGLDDVEVLIRTAATHDIVIHTASGSHKQSALDLIAGLAGRSKRTGQMVHYIHTSGACNLAEAALAGNGRAMIPFSDQVNDIATTEIILNEKHPFAQRATNIAQRASASSAKVNAYIIMPPDVYGIGTGPFDKVSTQIGRLVLDARNHGRVGMVNEGLGEIGHVHVEDLASFYQLLVSKIINHENVGPGTFFCSQHTHMWRNVAHLIGRIGVEKGKLEISRPEELSEQEAANRWTKGDLMDLSMGFLACFETKSDRAKALGWVPEKGDKEWGEWVMASAKAAFK